MHEPGNDDERAGTQRPTAAIEKVEEQKIVQHQATVEQLRAFFGEPSKATTNAKLRAEQGRGAPTSGASTAGQPHHASVAPSASTSSSARGASSAARHPSDHSAAARQVVATTEHSTSPSPPATSAGSAPVDESPGTSRPHAGSSAPARKNAAAPAPRPPPDRSANTSSHSSGVVLAPSPEVITQGARPEPAPAEADAVIRRFNSSGVLLSTIQTQIGPGAFKRPAGGHLKAFFENAVGPGQGVRGQTIDIERLTPPQRLHPTVNWSLAHQRLIANYFQLTSEGDAEPEPDWPKAKRSIAIIADPARIGEKFLSSGTSGLKFGKDASTSSTAASCEGKQVYSQTDADTELARLLREEITSQESRRGQKLDNTEIKTFGFDPDAIIGFIATFLGEEEALIQSAVNLTGSRHERFPVFTWTIQNEQTELKYLKTITRQATPH